MEKVITSTVSMRNCSAMNTHFFRMSNFTLEKVTMTVRNPLTKAPSLLIARDLTQEQGLMSAVNVGNPLAKATDSFNTTEVTLQQGLISAMNVGKPSATN